MTAICSVEGCTDYVRYKGLCGKHYKRQWRHGNVDVRLLREYKAGDKCETEGCNNPPRDKGFCKACSIRFSRRGKGAARLVAPKGSGTINGDGYRVLTVNGKRVYEHRKVMEEKLGRELTSKEVVHHENTPNDVNDPDKLMLFESQSEHMKYHRRMRLVGS